MLRRLEKDSGVSADGTDAKAVQELEFTSRLWTNSNQCRVMSTIKLCVMSRG